MYIVSWSMVLDIGCMLNVLYQENYIIDIYRYNVYGIISVKLITIIDSCDI